MKKRPAHGEDGLTDRQRRFVEAYLLDPNATAAAISAGYSAKTARVTSCDLMKVPAIVAALSKAQTSRARRVQIAADDVLLELKRIALADIAQAFDADGKLKPLDEMPEDVRRAIASIETDELYEGTGQDRTHVGVTRKVKFWDKTAALTLAMKHLKLLTERVEHKVEFSLGDLVLAARRARGEAGQ